MRERPGGPPMDPPPSVPGAAAPSPALPLPLDAAARRFVAGRTEQLFRESGALRDGHFALKSGRHGDRYLEKFQVLQYPAAVTELCAFIAERARTDDGRPLVDVVCGPTTGGVILAFEVARQLGVRGIFAEEVAGPDGLRRREFRRGFRIEPGERVLLVDDILTTGGSLLAMVLVDRSGGTREVTSTLGGRSYPAEALWTLDIPTFEPGSGTCPGCTAGLPLETPGAGGAKPGTSGT